MCFDLFLSSAKYRASLKSGKTDEYFAKFPKDVVLAEKATDGDEDILEKEPYAEIKSERVNYREVR